MEEWRGRLWQQALASAGIDDPSLGAALQARFTQHRTDRFIWEPRVKVRNL